MLQSRANCEAKIEEDRVVVIWRGGSVGGRPVAREMFDGLWASVDSLTGHEIKS